VHAGIRCVGSNAGGWLGLIFCVYLAKFQVVYYIEVGIEIDEYIKTKEVSKITCHFLSYLPKVMRLNSATHLRHV
jgi:hypothetical protein